MVVVIWNLSNNVGRRVISEMQYVFIVQTTPFLIYLNQRYVYDTWNRSDAYITLTLIESDKTTSIYNVSTRVLSKK